MNLNAGRACSGLTLPVLTATCQGADEDGYHPLFTGRDLSGWKFRRVDVQWRVKGVETEPIAAVDGVD